MGDAADGDDDDDDQEDLFWFYYFSSIFSGNFISLTIIIILVIIIIFTAVLITCEIRMPGHLCVCDSSGGWGGGGQKLMRRPTDGNELVCLMPAGKEGGDGSGDNEGEGWEGGDFAFKV